MDDDFLQIPGYKPTWIDDTSEFINVHAASLDALVGATITAIYVLWDLQNDEHFRDAPVVIGLDPGAPLEVCANKFADLSITRGLIDLGIGVKWDWGEEPWLFEWRRDHVPGIRCVLGQRVLAVEIIENELVMGRGRSWCLGGIEFVTVNGALSVFNGLDDTQVGMSREPEGWRRVARPDRGS